MTILIVAATRFEIKPFIDALSPAESSPAPGFETRFGGNETDILVTGIGMVATAYHLGCQLTKMRYDLVVNAGIAGSFNAGLVPGTLVNVVEDDIPEMGAEDGDGFLSVFDLGFFKPDRLPFTGGKLRMPSLDGIGQPIRDFIETLPQVTAITSNTIRGNRQSVERIRKMFPADIETMEGAAFFYACLTAGIPCLQLRSISNYVEERDTSKWETAKAVQHLNDGLIRICR